MTTEQREAIEICKEKIIESFYDFPNPTSIELKDTDVRAIETVLNMLKEKDELYHKALTDLVKADRENIQIKKQIDLMAEHILLYNAEKENTELPDGFSTYKKALLNKEEVKKYFAGLVEKE